MIACLMSTSRSSCGDGSTVSATLEGTIHVSRSHWEPKADRSSSAKRSEFAELMESMISRLKQSLPKLFTLGLVVLTAAIAYFLYQRWQDRPWTRDAQVRATIVKITPQVQGYLVGVPIVDNQFVRKGDLLFEIDPADYQLAVDTSREALDQARDEVASLEASVRVAQAQYQEAKISVSSTERKIDAAEASVQSALAAVDQAKAGIESAEQLINQRKAELDNARSEAERAKRLVAKKAGSTEDAESTAATAIAREAQLASARAGLTQAQASLKQAEAGYSEAQVNLLLSKDTLSEARAAEASAKAALDQAKATMGSPGEDNVRIRTAETNLAKAELDLSRTKIVAPCNGYVSNLSVAAGTYAPAGQPLVALVDSDSFRVHAYFQETKLRHMREGSRAVVILMGYPNTPIEGVVENIGNAVNPPNVAPTEGQVGEVPQIQPTFDWVRLAQRVPVRISLSNVPDGIQLISGTTASVAITPATRN